MRSTKSRGVDTSDLQASLSLLENPFYSEAAAVTFKRTEIASRMKRDAIFQMHHTFLDVCSREVTQHDFRDPSKNHANGERAQLIKGYGSALALSLRATSARLSSAKVVEMLSDLLAVDYQVVQAAAANTYKELKEKIAPKDRAGIDSRLKELKTIYGNIGMQGKSVYQAITSALLTDNR